MNDKEAIEMMARCSEEIKSLRGQIAALAPRAQAYDDISTLLRAAIPRPSQGMGEDLAWLLDRRIGEIKKQMAEEPVTKNQPEDEGDQP